MTTLTLQSFGPSDPVIVEHGRVLDLLCEGPIYGLSTGDLQSVYLDNVPCQNSDGTSNLKDVYFAIVNGTASQPAIKGMSEIESEATIQAKATILTGPATGTITNPSATACRVKISVPALYLNAGGTLVTFAIDVNNGSGWVRKVFPPGTPVGTPTTLAVDGSAKTITRNAGSFITDGYFVGQTIRTTGFAAPGNNQKGLVITTLTATVATFADAVGLVTAGASSAAAITSSTLDGSLKGRFTSKYTKAYRIPLTGTGPWQVRLTRCNADSPDPTTWQKDLYLESLTTIVEARLKYPYSAMAAVSVDAKQYSKIPSRSYKMKLLLIQVPANYDPITRVYAATGTGTTGGVWDGTFKTAWSDNPAWCFYDLATQPRYGAGAFLDVSKIDKWSLYTIAQYCDALVPDGLGGTEPRFRCNCFTNSRQEGIKLLNFFASTFRGMAYWASGVITAIQDVDSSPAALFTASNVIDGKFSYSGTARRARHTAAVVYWNDPNNLYKRTPEYVEDQTGIARYGLNQIEVTAFACASQGQARRLGLWTLASELTETETVTFQTGMAGVIARPGEIIQVQDQFRTGTRAGGMIAASSLTTVTLDAPVTLAGAVSYQISAMLPDGTIETRLVTTGAGTTNLITVSPAFSVAPQVQGQWVMVAGDGSMRTEVYRAISISESEGVYSVTALLHNAAKYSAIESGLVVSPGDTVNFDAFEPVQDLVGSEVLKEVGGVYLVALLASWTAQPNAVDYTAVYSLNSGAWVPMTVSGPSAELDGVNLGTYRIRVQAHYPAGISSYSETEYTVAGSSILGSTVDNLTSAYSAGQSLLQWDALNIKGLDYEIRMGSTWGSAKILGRTSEAWFETVSDGTYWVATRFASSYGTPSSIAIAGATLVKNVVATWDEKGTSWVGTLSGDAVIQSTNLTLTAGTYLGYYEIPASHQIDVGTVMPCTVSAAYTFVGAPVNDQVSSWPSISGRVSIMGAVAGDSDVSLQIDTAPASGTFTGTWRPLIAGRQYVARKFKLRAVLTSLDPDVVPALTALAWTVDMPDRVERGTGVSIAAGGTAVTYAIPFTTTTGQTKPNLQVTVSPVTAGDDIFITLETNAGFTVQIKNGGTGVARTVNWISQGY